MSICIACCVNKYTSVCTAWYVGLSRSMQMYPNRQWHIVLVGLEDQPSFCVVKCHVVYTSLAGQLGFRC